MKFCKNGVWVEVTIDDYFPCSARGGPKFSQAHGNELWVLILEKAYAKLHGSYIALEGGQNFEAFMDLTGYPTLNFDFSSEEIKAQLEDGSFF